MIAHHPESCLSQFRQYSLEPSAQLTESQQQGQTESKTVSQYKQAAEEKRGLCHEARPHNVIRLMFSIEFYFPTAVFNVLNA